MWRREASFASRWMPIWRPVRSASPGPGKRDRELEAGISRGCETINLESEGEAGRALAIGDATGRDAQAGGAGQSGFRAAWVGHADGRRGQAVRRRCRARAAARPAVAGGVRISAGSTFLPDRSRSTPHAIIEAQACDDRAGGAAVGRNWASRPTSEPGRRLRDSVFRRRHAARCRADRRGAGGRAARPPCCGGPVFALELGRWLVGEAGVYLTRIVERKESGGLDIPDRPMAGCTTSLPPRAISERW